jgi:hypothetical protein
MNPEASGGRIRSLIYIMLAILKNTCIIIEEVQI